MHGVILLRLVRVLGPRCLERLTEQPMNNARQRFVLAPSYSFEFVELSLRHERDHALGAHRLRWAAGASHLRASLFSIRPHDLPADGWVVNR